MTNATAALSYATDYGWAVHPVGVDKVPTTKHGRNDATKDPAMIDRFFRNGAQIGIATGPESGLFVLDVDLDPKKQINGYITLEHLEKTHGPLPLTPCQKTGRGGAQYLFRYVEGLKNSTGKLGEGIDTRGDGGYIVVAPSRNSAGPYTWVIPPDAVPLADVPQWIIKALKAPEKPLQPRQPSTGDNERAYHLKLLGQAVAKVATSSDGQKHDVLLKMATWMGGLSSLSDTEIEAALWSAIALRADDEQNARKTIADGIAYGRAKPLHTPAPRQSVDRSTGEIYDEPRPQAKTEYTVNHLSDGITLADLQYKEFPPERWIVEGILPEGALLFAAKYKSKKSWMVLAVGLAVAMGGIALGRLPVVQGDVLYLDLEGRQQRIQKRTRAMLGVRQCTWPANFTVFTKWRRGDEALEDLEHWLMAHPNAAMVVIDVLASFRRPMDKAEGFYDYDRSTVDPINELAEKYHVAIILVHHFNKGKHDDIMDSITGSTGLPSAVNTMWALRRDVNDSSIQVLEMRGRDLENDDPLALKWDSYLNQHIIEGPAAEVATSHERRAILKILDDDEPRMPKDIATELGRPVATIQQLMRKLVNDGLVDKVGYGKYAKVRHRDQSDHTDHTDHTDQSDQSLKGKSDQTLIDSANSDRSSIDRSELVAAAGSPKVPQNANSDRSDRYLNAREEMVDPHTISEPELFAADVPQGLTPAQWEQARYTLALGRFAAFADVARSIPMDYHELKKLVEGSTT